MYTLENKHNEHHRYRRDTLLMSEDSVPQRILEPQLSEVDFVHNQVSVPNYIRN